MASKFTCDCGELIRTNLFEGHNLNLMVSENVVNSTEDVSKVIEKSQVVVDCRNCGNRYFIDNDYNFEKYKKEQ